MAEELIVAFVNEEIPLDTLTTWIQSPEYKLEILDKYSCEPQELISYFLNYVHDNGIGEIKSNEVTLQETPQKLIREQTPKSGKKGGPRKRISLNSVAEITPKSKQKSPNEYISKTSDFPSLNTSTPKGKKAESSIQLSPAWNPRWSNEKQKGSKRTWQQPLELRLGDFLHRPGQSRNSIETPKRNQKRKRIKPTAVLETSASSNFNNSLRTNDESFQEFSNASTEEDIFNRGSNYHEFNCTDHSISEADIDNRSDKENRRSKDVESQWKLQETYNEDSFSSMDTSEEATYVKGTKSIQNVAGQNLLKVQGCKMFPKNYGRNQDIQNNIDADSHQLSRSFQELQINNQDARKELNKSKDPSRLQKVVGASKVKLAVWERIMEDVESKTEQKEDNQTKNNFQQIRKETQEINTNEIQFQRNIFDSRYQVPFNFKDVDSTKLVSENATLATSLVLINSNSQKPLSQTNTTDFTQQSSFVEISSKTAEESRNQLVKDWLHVQGNHVQGEELINFNKTQKSDVVAHYRSCTSIQELNRLAELYIFLFQNNFILNFVYELYFLLTILVSRNCKSTDEEEMGNPKEVSSKVDLKGLFASIHNRVYFSLKTLKALLRYLQIFDRVTLNLLLSNDCMREFGDPFNLCSELELLIIAKSKWERKSDDADIEGLDIRNVTYLRETDNGDNFPSDTSFHSFKKQRDLFYEIMKIWEMKHGNPEWNFHKFLGDKMEVLVNMYNSPINYHHLARLVKSQLLLMFTKEIQGELYMPNEEAILQQLPDVETRKMNRLKSRMLMNDENININALPTFNGYQEFFKDFITTISVSSNSTFFIDHFRDSIRTEILVENDVEFSGCEFGRKEKFLKHRATVILITQLKRTRVLAKFLGFIESLSYYQPDFKKPSKRMLESQIATRLYYKDCFGLKELILESIQKHRMVFTLSWVVVYLSMLDYATLRIPYYQEILRILFCLYDKCKHTYLTDTISNIDLNTESLSQEAQTVLLLRISLGWLFELPHFPNEFYQQWLSANEVPKDVAEVSDWWSGTDSDGYFTDKLNGKFIEGFPIDHLKIVDWETLYACCPSLEVFKKALLLAPTKVGMPTKHITPLSTIRKGAREKDGYQYDRPIPVEQSEPLLERAFLNSHPPMTRKIVEFVTECVGLACKQHLRNSIAPTVFRTIAFGYVDSANTIYQLYAEDYKHSEEVFVNEIRRNITEIHKKVHEECMHVARNIIPDRTYKAVSGQLSMEDLPQVITVCSKLATKMSLEQVQMWLNYSITRALVEQHILQEGKKIIYRVARPMDRLLSTLPSGGRPGMHNEYSQSPSQTAQILTKTMIAIVEQRCIGDEEISSVMKNANMTLRERGDVNENMQYVIQKLMVDLFLTLVAFRVYTAEHMLNTFQSYWSSFTANAYALSRFVLCPRTVQMITQSRDVNRSWKMLTNLLIAINESNLISAEDLERQSVEIFRVGWDAETLRRISDCFRSLKGNIKPED